MATKRLVDGPFVSRTMSYAVRSDRIHSPSFLHELEQAVWSVNPSLPLANVQTLDQIRADSMAQTSFTLTMLVIGALMALLLGIVGLYGVIAYTGIALGVGAALALSRVMRALLFGVSPTDPLTYAAVSGALAAVMLLAMYLPARRAARVDPVVALRADR